MICVASTAMTAARATVARSKRRLNVDCGAIVGARRGVEVVGIPSDEEAIDAPFEGYL